MSCRSCDLKRIYRLFEEKKRREAEAAETKIVAEDLKSIGLDLWDIKIEWGRDAETGKLMLIDEVSANGCRAYDMSGKNKIAGTALSDCFRA